jgi:hypothetical protein
MFHTQSTSHFRRMEQSIMRVLIRACVWERDGFRNVQRQCIIARRRGTFGGNGSANASPFSHTPMLILPISNSKKCYLTVPVDCMEFVRRRRKKKVERKTGSKRAIKKL